MPIPASVINLDLYDLVLKTILKLSRCGGTGEGFWSGWGCLTGDFSHDFIISFLLPHIIILIFIFGTSRGLMAEHRGLGNLFGLAIYIFIVYSGWYPIFAKFTLLWLFVSILLTFYMFIVGRMFPPTTASTLTRMFGKKKSERAIKARINNIESQLNNRRLNPQERKQLQAQLKELRDQLS